MKFTKQFFALAAAAMFLTGCGGGKGGKAGTKTTKEEFHAKMDQVPSEHPYIRATLKHHQEMMNQKNVDETKTYNWKDGYWVTTDGQYSFPLMDVKSYVRGIENVGSGMEITYYLNPLGIKTVQTQGEGASKYESVANSSYNEYGLCVSTESKVTAGGQAVMFETYECTYEAKQEPAGDSQTNSSTTTSNQTQSATEPPVNSQTNSSTTTSNQTQSATDPLEDSQTTFSTESGSQNGGKDSSDTPAQIEVTQEQFLASLSNEQPYSTAYVSAEVEASYQPKTTQSYYLSYQEGQWVSDEQSVMVDINGLIAQTYIPAVTGSQGDGRSFEFHYYINTFVFTMHGKDSNTSFDITIEYNQYGLPIAGLQNVTSGTLTGRMEFKAQYSK